MPISGGLAGSGGGALVLESVNRLYTTNAAAGNASDNVIFMGTSAGAANAGTRNIGLGINASRNAFTTDLIVIGNNNPTNIGQMGSNDGSTLIGNAILSSFTPSVSKDLTASVLIGNSIFSTLSVATDVTRNVVVGFEAGKGLAGSITPVFDCVDNVILGYRAGYALQNDSGAIEAVIIGSKTLDSTSPGSSYNYRGVVIGALAAESANIANSVIIGNQAAPGVNTTYSGTTRLDTSNDVIIGPQAGGALRLSVNNTFVGSSCCGQLEYGSYNTVIGSDTNLIGAVGGSPLSLGNTVIGNAAGNYNVATKYVISIGNLSARSTATVADGAVFIESYPSALHDGAVPFLFGNSQNGNLMLGNREDGTGAINRVFGTGAVNNFKIQKGVAPSTPPDLGVSLYVTEAAGVYTLRAIGPAGTPVVVATGL